MLCAEHAEQEPEQRDDEKPVARAHLLMMLAHRPPEREAPAERDRERHEVDVPGLILEQRGDDRWRQHRQAEQRGNKGAVDQHRLTTCRCPFVVSGEVRSVGSPDRSEYAPVCATVARPLTSV